MEKNKINKEKVLYFLIGVSILTLFIISLIFVGNGGFYKDNCLENVAESYCDSINMTFSFVAYLDMLFYCREIKDYRIKSDLESFKFSSQVKKGCRKW